MKSNVFETSRGWEAWILTTSGVSITLGAFFTLSEADAAIYKFIKDNTYV